MKCVILAGKREESLMPFTGGGPVSMLNIFDRSLLSHLIQFFERGGATEIYVELSESSAELEAESQSGAELSFISRKRSSGTAEFAGICAGGCTEEESVLIASADLVCDFELRSCLLFHKSKRADVTLLLSRGRGTAGGAAVRLNPDGGVKELMIRPVWGQVTAEASLTGIYIINGKVLSQSAGKKSLDFIQDLFPRLIKDGKRVYGCTAEGFYKKIVSPESYMECVRELLEGQSRIEFGAPQIQKGIWTNSELPRKARINPPCYIGESVTFGAGAEAGPYTMLCRGVSMGAGATVSNSLCGSGAVIDEGALLEGAVIGADTVIRPGARVGRGDFTGEGAAAEENALVSGGESRRGGRGTRDVEERSPYTQNSLFFSEEGSISGYAGIDINPRLCLCLGGTIGGKNRIGISAAGGSYAELLLGALESGLLGAGSEVIRTDGCFYAAAAFSCRLYGLSGSVFVLQEGSRVRLYVLDKSGLPPDRKTQRYIERHLSYNHVKRENSLLAGKSVKGGGLVWAYAAAAAEKGRLPGRPLAVKAAVTGEGQEAEVLSRTLVQSGVSLQRPEGGTIKLSARGGGTILRVIDEDGRYIHRKKLMALLALSEFEYGGGVVVLPEDAPIIIEELAEKHACQVLRHRAESGEVGPELMFRDCAFAAARLCSWLAVSGRRLSEQAARLPDFSVSSKEIKLLTDSGSMIKRLSRELPSSLPDGEGGLRLREEKGWVRIKPIIRKSAIRILTEAGSLELAEELCGYFEGVSKRLDSRRESP